ncbi:type II secretion system protein [Pseudohongiella sp. O18]|uniref:type II secretion system protein n=1 Tax=Pseudohongiella sp. O18 TaxID=2904248 RepID=UPI002351A0FA|nr:type II secretion system protein [Pseudohongiella sp. O18]
MNIQLKSKQQKGFTIIELIVVILLLGILAATALPRFLDVTDEAHDAVVDGLVGGLNTGAALFRATWVAQGQSVTEDVDGFGLGTLFANSNGYPVGTTTSANMTATSCEAIYNGLLQSGRPEAADVTVPFADIASATAISEDIDTAAGADADMQVAAVTIPDAGGYDDAVECRYYYIGQFRRAPASDATAATIPLLTLSLTNGEVTVSDFTYQLPTP